MSKGKNTPHHIGSKHPSGAKPKKLIFPNDKHKAANGKPEQSNAQKGNPRFQLNKKAMAHDPKESYVERKDKAGGGGRGGSMKAVGPNKKARHGLQPKFPGGGIT